MRRGAGTVLAMHGAQRVAWSRTTLQGYDLLEAHYNQLNADIADFTQELQVGA